MAREERVQLRDPIQGHGELINEVVLREPRSHEFFSLGEPFIVAKNSDGSMFPVENGDAIRSYIERCCVKPDALLLGQLSLSDAMAVKEAMLRFFEQAQATSKAPATPSSTT